MQRLFIITLATVVTLAAALGAFLFFSLWPYIDIIGRVAAGLVITGLCCVAAILVTFTWTRIGLFFARLKRERLHANLLVSGDVVVLLRANGEFSHLSAQHEMAKIAPPAQIVESDEDPGSPDEVVLELWRRGVTLRNIEKVTGRKYHEVQKITSAAKRQTIAD